MTLQAISHMAALSGGVLYAIAVVLFIGMAVIADRAWALMRTSTRGQAVESALSRWARLDDAALRDFASNVAAGPHRALLEVPLRHPEVRDAGRLGELLEEAIMRQAPRIDQRLWLLDTAVTLGPLLGLLGTIIGIFHAFKGLGSPGVVPAQITGNVAEALVATAAGLLVAIIGLVCFNGLQKRVRLVVHQLDTLKVMLVNRLAE